MGHLRLAFFPWVHALFMRSASTEFSKFCFKIGFHGTIYTFKNYFIIMFSAINY